MHCILKQGLSDRLLVLYIKQLRADIKLQIVDDYSIAL